MQFGKIPSKLLFVSTPAETFTSRWEHADDTVLMERTVYPCFVADQESEDQVAQARRWGANRTQRTPDASVKELSGDNTPRTIFVCGLEQRQEGGRAFKVVDEDGRLLDMREDVLLECLTQCGVEKGGRILGQFVFARIHSQTRLVRVGSQLHTLLIESNKRRASKNLSASDLVVGGVYANRRGLVIYMGRIDTIEDQIVGGRGSCMQTAAANAIFKAHVANRDLIDPYVKRVVVEGEHVSLPIASYQSKDDVGHFFSNCLRNPPFATKSTWQFSKTFTAVELVKTVSVDGWLGKLQKLSFERLQQRLADDAKDRENHGEPLAKYLRTRDVCEASAILNMTLHNQGAKATPQYEELFKQWVTLKLED